MDINLSQKAEVGSATYSIARKQPTTAAMLLASANSSRLTLLIQNIGTVDVYLGLAGVATTTGILLKAGSALTDDISSSAWYAITASGTADLRILEAVK